MGKAFLSSMPASTATYFEPSPPSPGGRRIIVLENGLGLRVIQTLESRPDPHPMAFKGGILALGPR